MDESNPQSRKSVMRNNVLLLEPLWLLLLGLPLLFPGRLLPLTWHGYLILGLFLFWPIRWFYKLHNRSFKSPGHWSHFIVLASPLSLSVIVLLGWIPIALWASVSPVESLVAAGYLLYGICLWVMFANCLPLRTRPDLVVGVLLSATLLLAVLAPVITDWKAQMRIFRLPIYGWLEGLPFRPTDMIHANVLAGAMVIALPIALALAVRPPESCGACASLSSQWSKQQWLVNLPRAWLWIISAIFLTVLIFSQSRAAYLAMGVSLSIIFAWRFHAFRVVASLWTLLLIIFSIQIGPAAFFAERGSDAALGGWSGRLEIWAKSLDAIRDFPFTGIGIGTFQQVIPLLYPLRVSVEDFPHAHNLYLQVALDLGIPGLIGWLAVMIAAMALSSMMIYFTNNPHPSVVLSVSSCAVVSSEEVVDNAELDLPKQFFTALSVGVVTSLTAFFIHGLLDVVLWGNKLAFLPWLLLAIIVTQQEALSESQHP